MIFNRTLARCDMKGGRNTGRERVVEHVLNCQRSLHTETHLGTLEVHLTLEHLVNVAQQSFALADKLMFSLSGGWTDGWARQDQP